MTRPQQAQEPQLTALMLVTLDQVAVLSQRLERAVRRPPAPGSHAALDLAEPLAANIAVLAGGALSVGLDHLTTWRAVLASGSQPAFAHMTLLRAALETSVTCRWLLDPRVDTAERIRRGVAAQLADYGERWRWEEDTGLDRKEHAPPSMSAPERIEELRPAAAAAGILPGSMPKFTALMEGWAPPGYRNHRHWYRLVSAYAHGKQWALLSASLDLEPPQAGLIGAARGQVSANDQLATQMTALAVNYVTVAVGDYEAYIGR